MTTHSALYPDLVRGAAASTDASVADVEQARADGEAALAELRQLEVQAPPPLRASPPLARKLTEARHTSHPAVMLREVTAQIRQAIAAQHVWCADVAAARADVQQALVGDASVQQARAAAQQATARADELRARLATRRADLAALETEGPGSADEAATWASKSTALRAEVTALARLVSEAEQAEQAAAGPVQAAHATITARATAQATAEVAAARQAWQEALAELNRKHQARVTAAERGVGVLQSALATL